MHRTVGEMSGNGTFRDLPVVSCNRRGNCVSVQDRDLFNQSAIAADGKQDSTARLAEWTVIQTRKRGGGIVINGPGFLMVNKRRCQLSTFDHRAFNANSSTVTVFRQFSRCSPLGGAATVIARPAGPRWFILHRSD